MLSYYYNPQQNNFNRDFSTVNKYSSSINANILSLHMLSEDLLNVSNVLKLKTLTNVQLERLDGTLKNVIAALYDVKTLLG